MGSVMVVLGLLAASRDPLGWIARHLRQFNRVRAPGLTATDEARLLREVAAELSAGVHPTAAFLTAAGARRTLDVAASARHASIGEGTVAVTNKLASQLPVNRDILGPAAGIAIEAGVGLAAVLYRLADRADAVADEQRERTVATAQARLSAAVVGGLPLAGVLAMAMTGGFSDLDALSLELVAVAMSLLVCGLAVTAWMVRP